MPLENLRRLSAVLFTSAGDWLIETRDCDNKVLGTAVPQVRTTQ